MFAVVCHTGSDAVAVTQRPLGVSAVPLITSRGRAVPRSTLYSEALLYSLLGLCIIVLMFTLTAAILLLLRRAKHQQQQQQLDTKKQQPKRQGQSSKGEQPITLHICTTQNIFSIYLSATISLIFFIQNIYLLTVLLLFMLGSQKNIFSISPKKY